MVAVSISPALVNADFSSIAVEGRYTFRQLPAMETSRTRNKICLFIRIELMLLMNDHRVMLMPASSLRLMGYLILEIPEPNTTSGSVPEKLVPVQRLSPLIKMRTLFTF